MSSTLWQSLDNKLVIGNKMITVVREQNPAKIPWNSLKVELVVDCSTLPDSQVKLRLKRIAETKGNYHFMRKQIFFPAEQEIQ